MPKTTILWHNVRGDYTVVEFLSDDAPRALVAVLSADVERDYAGRESEFAHELLGAVQRALGHTQPGADERLVRGFDAGVPMFFTLIHVSGAVLGFEPTGATFDPTEPPTEHHLRLMGMAVALTGLRHPTWRLSAHFSIARWSRLPVPWSAQESGAHWRTTPIEA